ncbi:MAG TPA: P-II family nitrogen regulator [Clostridia bacterium]|nr:P-II family nitrogen regulator [Clostridia bacterium]
MEKSTNIRALFIVINAGFAEQVIEIARTAGARGATILNARGSGSVHKSILGISVDTEKEMVLCLVDKETADRVIDAVREKAGLGSPVNGICFTMPVEQVVGVNSCLTEEKPE